MTIISTITLINKKAILLRIFEPYIQFTYGNRDRQFRISHVWLQPIKQR